LRPILFWPPALQFTNLVAVTKRSTGGRRSAAATRRSTRKSAVAGATYRWWHARWTPYVGFGVGASFPHVEIRRTGTDIRTFEYQLTGVAIEGLVGVEYHIGPRVSAFADYKLSFSSNDADVKGGGRWPSGARCCLGSLVY
jgi:outer membrane autotransporter protein